MVDKLESSKVGSCFACGVCSVKSINFGSPQKWVSMLWLREKTVPDRMLTVRFCFEGTAP
jgi:hypothetical protein